MQEPWWVGLAIFALVVFWAFQQTLEDNLLGGALAWLLAPIQNWWRARHGRR